MHNRGTYRQKNNKKKLTAESSISPRVNCDTLTLTCRSIGCHCVTQHSLMSLEVAGVEYAILYVRSGVNLGVTFSERSCLVCDNLTIASGVLPLGCRAGWASNAKATSWWTFRCCGNLPALSQTTGIGCHDTIAHCKIILNHTIEVPTKATHRTAVIVRQSDPHHTGPVKGHLETKVCLQHSSVTTAENYKHILHQKGKFC